MQRSDISIVEIADELNVTKSYIGQQLRGIKRISRATLDSIADKTGSPFAGEIEVLAEASWRQRNPLPEGQTWVIVKGQRIQVAESELAALVNLGNPS